jgi:hypothetical protein
MSPLQNPIAQSMWKAGTDRRHTSSNRPEVDVNNKLDAITRSPMPKSCSDVPTLSARSVFFLFAWRRGYFDPSAWGRISTVHLLQAWQAAIAPKHDGNFLRITVRLLQN